MEGGADRGARGAAVRDPRGDDQFRRVATPGIFRHDKEMLLLARTRQGRPGVHVITPLRLPGGGHVMIDRGWVPDALKDPARRRASQVTGVV